MSLWCKFWEDEAGAVVSAELVAVSTVAVVGGTVGLTQLRTSVNRELEEMAFSVRSLDQSYSVPGHYSGFAWTAGSCYTQPDVQLGYSELRAIADQQAPAKATPKKKAKAKAKKKQQVEEDAAFLEPAELPSQGLDPVEPADDVSKAEVVIEPGPDA